VAIELRSRLQKVELATLDDGRGGGGGNRWLDVDGVKVLLPPTGLPKAVVHFIGGAVLGLYPHVAYDALLARVAEGAQVAVVAPPYELALEHDDLAQESAAQFERTMAQLRQRFAGLFPSGAEALPVYGLGHSLGAKLQLLLQLQALAEPGPTAAAAEGAGGEDRRRAGFYLISFNNFSAGDNVRLLEQYARELLQRRRGSGGAGGAPMDRAAEALLGAMPMLARVAEGAAAQAGLEFTPSAEETLARAEARLPSTSMPTRMRLVSFSDDSLDQAPALASLLRRAAEDGNSRLSNSEAELEGDHLTPVYLRVQGADVAASFARLGTISMGDEARLKALAMDTIGFLRGFV